MGKMECISIQGGRRMTTTIGKCRCDVIHKFTYSAIYKKYTDRLGYECNICGDLIILSE